MKEHGITTSGAHFWAHVFPEAKSVYWYSAAAALLWIKENGLKQSGGRSKDGSLTGRGIKMPKDAPFVVEAKISDQMFRAFDWARGTDRQRGQWGENVIWWMLLTRKITPPMWAARPMRSKREQFDLGDFELSFVPQPVWEVKTEGKDYASSPYLFIQTGEKGHKATLVRLSDGQVIENVTALPGFENDA